MKKNDNDHTQNIKKNERNSIEEDMQEHWETKYSKRKPKKTKYMHGNKLENKQGRKLNYNTRTYKNIKETKDKDITRRNTGNMK